MPAQCAALLLKILRGGRQKIDIFPVGTETQALPPLGDFGVHAVPLGSGRQPMAAEIGDAGRTGYGPAAGG